MKVWNKDRKLTLFYFIISGPIIISITLALYLIQTFAHHKNRGLYHVTR